MAWFRKSKDISLYRRTKHWHNIGRLIETDDKTRAAIVDYVIHESFTSANIAINLLSDDVSIAKDFDELREMVEGRKLDIQNAQRIMLTREEDGNPR